MPFKPRHILECDTDNYWNDDTHQSVAFDLWKDATCPECGPADIYISVAVCSTQQGRSTPLGLVQIWNGRYAQSSLCDLQARAGQVC